MRHFPNPGKTLYRSALMASALALVSMVVAVPDAAQASGTGQSVAMIEAQTRPNFGVLLDPPTRSRARAHRRWDYGRHYGPAYPRPPRLPPMEDIVLVDCGGNTGSGAVEAAVSRVRPGGTLMIRARSGPCVGWLNIDKPMTIIGDSGYDPRAWGPATQVTLQAPDGLPCMTVAPGVRVEVRDLVFGAPQAGGAACVVGYDADILLSRVAMRYSGEEAAIYTDGGLLDVRDVLIEARTLGPALVADRTAVTVVGAAIAGPQSGIELTPGVGAPSSLSALILRGADQPNNFGPRAIGVLIRSGRDYGQVSISSAKICGFTEGVAVEGASVSVTNSSLCKVDKGAVLYNGELRFTQNRVRAGEVGVAAASGLAVITGNMFAGVRSAPIYGEPRAAIQAQGNRVWSREHCRPRFEPRYRDRYVPVWEHPGGDYYTCERGAYPRDWWENEDGIYQDHAYPLESYERFLGGYGWYDANGRYIPSDRPRGEARWRGGWWR